SHARSAWPPASAINRWSERAQMRSPSRSIAVRTSAILLLVLELVSSAVPAVAVTASAKPNHQTLYKRAEQARAALAASPKLQAKRPEWEKVVLRYRTVITSYPQSGYCD